MGSLRERSRSYFMVGIVSLVLMKILHTLAHNVSLFFLAVLYGLFIFYFFLCVPSLDGLFWYYLNRLQITTLTFYQTILDHFGFLRVQVESSSFLFLLHFRVSGPSLRFRDLICDRNLLTSRVEKLKKDRQSSKRNQLKSLN